MRKDNQSGTGSGRLATTYLKQDSLLDSMSRAFGLEVRDFVLMSFLVEEGPMTTHDLGGLTTMQPIEVLSCVKRLGACGLVIRDPIESDPHVVATISLTEDGHDVMRLVEQGAE